MQIDGFTCCVGVEYSKYLADNIGKWLSNLDRVTVITKPDDAAAHTFRGFSRQLKVIETDIFTRYTASFNKGAALDLGFQVTRPHDWVLQFDSDITPPKSWRTRAEDRIVRGLLYGTSRYNISGKRIGVGLFPSGYFQLWHFPDPFFSGQPYVFNPFYTHAGSYDAEFADQWGKHRIKDLQIQLIHHGQRRHNWFGPDANQDQMNSMMQQGFREARTDEKWMIPIEHRHTILEDIRCVRLIEGQSSNESETISVE